MSLFNWVVTPFIGRLFLCLLWAYAHECRGFFFAQALGEAPELRDLRFLKGWPAVPSLA